MRKIKWLLLVLGCSLVMVGATLAGVRGSAAALGAGTNKTGKIEQLGPPWLDEAWKYRRPLVISNPAASLAYYQVLVVLDGNNFDFGRAKADGSDIRLTHSDGTTLLTFWIEAWDGLNQLAYLWVKVPSLSQGETTIYIYYDNPTAIPASDGKTFDFFDDFWQFSGSACSLHPSGALLDPLAESGTVFPYSPQVNPWCVLSGTPAASGSILYLPDGTGIRQINSQLYKAIGFRANYGLGSGKEWAGFIDGATGARTLIGDLPGAVDDLFLVDQVSEQESVLLPRVGEKNWHDAYHVYEIDWSEGQSVANIDHGAAVASSTQPSQVPGAQLPVTLYSYTGSLATLQVDWVYVRQYRLPEPTAVLGHEQGLVDLAIDVHDAPDPLYAGEVLAYHLAITNTGSLDAPGVLVTDTLPASVSFASASASQGSCTAGLVVLCQLNTIPGLGTASITILVTTTMDGMIDNLVAAGSPGYELDTSNNTAQAATTVNPSADLAITILGSPEVLLPGSILTYRVTVSNQGPSDAAGVGLLDNLPAEVRFVDVAPNTCSANGQQVSCTLGSLARQTEQQVVITTTVVATETVDIVNPVTTSSSQTHDPDLANNTALASNLLDKTPPVVNWEKPVTNDHTYFTYGGIVNLKVAAQDNDQVAYVKFLYYNHDNNQWITIGIVSSPPYQVPFLSDDLKVGELYQFFAQAYDRVNNYQLERIYIERLFPYYLYIPLLARH